MISDSYSPFEEDPCFRCEFYLCGECRCDGACPEFESIFGSPFES